MPTTEIATFLLPAESASSTHKSSTETSQKLEEIDLLRRQYANAAKDWRYGLQVENPNHLECITTRDDIESFEAEPQTSTQPSLDPKIASAPFSKHHVDFELYSDFLKAVMSPFTEICTVYFNGEPDEQYLEGVRKFREIGAAVSNSGIRATSQGVTHEELEHEGVKGRAVVVVAGWESLEAHAAFSKTDIFISNASLLMNGNVSHVEAHHVAFEGPL